MLTAKSTLGWQLLLGVCAFATYARAQDIAVSFRFADDDISKVEATPRQIEELVTGELVALLSESFPYWGFRASTDRSSDYRIEIKTSCCRPGSDRDLRMDVVYPLSLGNQPKGWDATLFRVGERAIYSGDSTRNPSGRAWIRAIREQFLKTVLRERREEIWKELWHIPVGVGIRIEEKPEGSRKQIAAWLTPRKAATGALEDATFTLIYRNAEESLYLEAFKPRSKTDAASFKENRPPPFRANLTKVVSPKRIGLMDIDSIIRTFASDCFLLARLSRFNPSLAQ